jgi:hypothetical protein
VTWQGSAVFAAYAADVITPSPAARDTWAAGGMNRYRLALFNGQITPDRAAPRDETLYGWGQWLVAGEVTSAALWPAGGVDPVVVPMHLPTVPGRGASGGVALGCPAGIIRGPGLTLLQMAGSLLYHSSALGGTGQGLCYHYFGGPVDVRAGIMSVTWLDITGVLEINVI